MTVSHAALGETAVVLSGFAFKSDFFNDNDGVPLIRIRDVTRGYSKTFYSGPYTRDFLVEDGDILIGMDGNFEAARWKGGPALLNQRVCRINGLPAILDDSYLFHFLAPALKKIENATPFVTVKHLSASDVRGIELPLPPLPEQRRIAAILDQADALRTKRREALAQLDSLTQSIFIEMFGDQQSQGWPIERIADMAALLDGSIRTGPFGSQLLHSEFVAAGVAVLGIDNAVANEFRWAERRFITEAKYRELRRYTVKPGDVLITIMGTCGRCAVVPDDMPVAINTKHLCCITLNLMKCLPEFLHAFFLRHPMARGYLEQTSKGAIMSGLNMGLIKAMPIPVPPLALQQTFATRIQAVESLKATHRAALAELDALFASLQHRAFAGQLS